MKFAAALVLTVAPAAAQPTRAPEFSIPTERGIRVSPNDFGGSLLVVNFWETACAPCVKELPSLSAFSRAFRRQGVVVIAITADGDRQRYRQFLRDHKVNLETFRDPTRRIAKSFGTEMFPETYLIRNGLIVRKVVGGIDWTGEEITSFVRSILNPRDAGKAQ
jgi:peroxiredoxin